MSDDGKKFGLTGPVGGLGGSIDFTVPTFARGPTGPAGPTMLTIDQLIGSAPAPPGLLDRIERLQHFEAENVRLQKQLSDQGATLRKQSVEANELERVVAEVKKQHAELAEHARLKFLLDRVNDAAQGVLLARDSKSEHLLSAFKSPRQNLFAVSIDIRRSTELMLKARDASKFADFITRLSTALIEIVKAHFGVVDKFTGDGILAFFPEFFSGPDAGFYALDAAALCHKAFKQHYAEARSSFSSVLTDVGLGIGIDYGEAALVEIVGGLTIVGPPVVYACRMGGCPPGETFLNQPAFEEVSTKHGAYFLMNETMLEIKHEGRLLAYSAKRAPNTFTPTLPDWAQAKTA